MSALDGKAEGRGGFNGLYASEHFDVASVLGAGLVAEALLALRPAATRPLHPRLFAFCLPAVVCAAHFLDIALTDGVWWSVHTWGGIIFLAGVVGWLLTLITPLPAAR